MVRDLELFSFDFSLLNGAIESLACPNCGFQIHRSTSLFSNGLSKSLIILGCGTILYMNCHKKNQFRSALFDFGSTLQYYGSSFLALLNGTKLDSTSKDSGCHYQTNISNHWLQCNLQNEEPNDLSIAFSSLNSIGSSTVAKFDYLLDQVQQIKECMNDSYNEFPSIQSPQCAERRLSDGEMTLPSLEWDLADMPLFNENNSIDDYHHFGGKKQSFLYNVKYNGIIDAEILSQIIFNKDFDFKERICDQINLRKYFATLRHQLKISSKNSYCSSNNIESVGYKSNRDSAYFEE